MDFALWKAAKPGEISWDSPWGKGRPGWHIECSAMNLAELGEQIDIHGGGNDLIFPHHENEIAQSESFTGKPFARYWMHNGMLQLGGEKMSKSHGNVINPDDLVSRYGADAVRTFLMFGYRWDQGGPWSSGGIEGSARWLNRVWALVVESGAESVERREDAQRSTPDAQRELRRATHKTIRSVTADFRAFEFNTIVSALMEFSNALIKAKDTPVYKTQVWGLASHVGLPESVVSKPPSADLWPDQTDEKEMGVTYAEADAILDKAAECGMNLIDTAECYGDHLSESLIGDYLSRHRIEGRIDPVSCLKCHGRQNNERCKLCHR